MAVGIALYSDKAKMGRRFWVTKAALQSEAADSGVLISGQDGMVIIIEAVYVNIGVTDNAAQAFVNAQPDQGTWDGTTYTVAAGTSPLLGKFAITHPANVAPDMYASTTFIFEDLEMEIVPNPVAAARKSLGWRSITTGAGALVPLNYVGVRAGGSHAAMLIVGRLEPMGVRSGRRNSNLI